MRLGLAQALFATANGPLALSVFALSNALVFHDVERWGSIIIHFGPALVSWALTWKSAAVQAAWPGAFGALARQACEAVRAGAKRDACEQENAAAIAAANAPLALYFTWWLVYGAWLLYTPNPDPNPNSDPDPNPNSDPNSDPDPDPDPDPNPNPNRPHPVRVTPNRDPNPNSDPDPNPNFDPDPTPNSDPDPTPNSDPNSDPDPDLDPDPKPGAWLLYVGCTLPERRGCRSSFDDMRPLIAKALAP